MHIYCIQCKDTIKARLTNGEEIYPHRPDLSSLPFWRCDTCKNYIGCHHRTVDRTKPLGNIPNPEMRNARKHIHAILDPLWKSKKHKRAKLYYRISQELGYQYHTGEIKCMEEARKIYLIIKKIINS